MDFQSEFISAYIGKTYANWRLEISDPTNPDGELRLGMLYLGQAMQLSKNAQWESQDELTDISQDETNDYGIGYMSMHAHQEHITLEYSDLLNADYTSLRAMKTTIHDPSTGIMKPLFLHLFSDEPDSLFLMHWKNGLPRKFAWKNKNALRLYFEEVVKTSHANI